MPNRFATALALALLLLVGSIYTLGSVDRSSSCREIDEPAWIFDSYYWTLYKSGDWGNEAWREFDRYAAHPPAYKYAMGIVLDAIGRPIRSIEPRKYWYEHDLSVARQESQREFGDAMARRLTFGQVMAGRYLSAAFGCLATIALFFLALRLAGPAAAAVGYAALVLHPLFSDISTLATADTMLMMLTLASLLIAVEVGRAAGKSPRVWALVPLLGIVLGISFATKIVAFANVLPVAIAAALVARDKRALALSLAAVAFSVLVGLAVAYALDPGIHGSAVHSTIDRFAMRALRVDIQRIIFASDRLGSFGARSVFAVSTIFFSGVTTSLLMALCAAGAISCFASGITSGVRRRRILISVLAAWSAALTVATLPMAWVRYAVAGVPLIALLAGCGAAFVLDGLKRWEFFERRARVSWLVASMVLIAAVAIAQRSLWPPSVYLPPFASAEDVAISDALAFSLMYPGEMKELNESLERYFKEKGLSRMAAFERGEIERIELRKDERGL